MGHDEQSGRSRTGRRLDVLRALKETSGPASIKDLADRLDVHPNTVRFHLESLVDAGQVERVELTHRGPGRPPQLFRAVPGMDPAGPRSYQVLVEILLQALVDDPEAGRRAAEAGRAWGRRYGAALSQAQGGDPSGVAESMDRLGALLDDIGFAPEVEESRIGLRHCPFLEVATAQPQIVCAIHLGLMQGAVGEWQAPLTVDHLAPFIEPDLCVAHIGGADGE